MNTPQTSHSPVWYPNVKRPSVVSVTGFKELGRWKSCDKRFSIACFYTSFVSQFFFHFVELCACPISQDVSRPYLLICIGRNAKLLILQSLVLVCLKSFDDAFKFSVRYFRKIIIRSFIFAYDLWSLSKVSSRLLHLLRYKGLSILRKVFLVDSWQVFRLEFSICANVHMYIFARNFKRSR